MAVHKVPQDVEADDKFIGPLSFKQFLFAGGALIFGYLSYLTISRGGALFSPIFLLPALGLGALAFPWSKEQPTELWLASRIRFFIKPRRRIWDQTGMKDLVTVTAPPQQIHAMTDGLTQSEVRTRFNALATMVDSRGWAVKSVPGTQPSDRLAQGTQVQAPTTAVSDNTDDVLDENSSGVAQNFTKLIEESEQHKKDVARELIEQARNPQPPAQPQSESTAASPQTTTPQNQNDSFDFWFKQQTQPSQQQSAPAQAPQAPPAQATPDLSQTTLSDEELLDKVHEKQRAEASQTHSAHEKTIDPLGSKNTQQPTDKADKPTATDSPTARQPVTPPSDPDILNLSRSNDLNIDVLSRQANKKDDDGEVVISLH